MNTVQSTTPSNSSGGDVMEDSIEKVGIVKAATEDRLGASLSIQRRTINNRTINGEQVVTSNAGPVLFIEDDPSTRQSVANFFEKHNIPVCAVAGGHEFGRYFAGGSPSLVIFDLHLGQGDGLVPLREIRSRSDVPIIVTSGDQCGENDRIVALELGADDCVTKPFSTRELLARARAVLRRHTLGQAARARDPKRGGFCFGGWRLERRARRLLDPKGNTVSLTKGVFVLLVAFLEAPKRLLSREHQLQATRIHEDVLDRSIDVGVMRLRRKLETDPSAPRIIKTDRGFGYLFALPVDPF
jgi:two-component system, OmpR family, response regulator